MLFKAVSEALKQKFFFAAQTCLPTLFQVLLSRAERIKNSCGQFFLCLDETFGVQCTTKNVQLASEIVHHVMYLK